MKELFLTNTQSALVPASRAGEEALASYPKDAVLRVRIVQPRSLPHHCFLFAFLAQAFEQWPEAHAFQPTDADNLRAWLIVRAGFYESIEFEWPNDTTGRHRITEMIKATVGKFSGNRPFWIRATGNKIIAAWPKSIAFQNIDEEEFRRITTIVFSVIYAETGIDVEEYSAKWQEKHKKLKVKPTRIGLRTDENGSILRRGTS